ncbi:hypothetical protein AVEN_136029-1 [Araneus ventricosus]|uniref:Uncharacterized protein n=1 Tax=Araneus ventricosus TaxID=182803 RepID=A0A4Y2ETA9_ARAVE|nr:hypothetical protein AVEN_136029-1 [Araneus ventricosus]
MYQPCAVCTGSATWRGIFRTTRHFHDNNQIFVALVLTKKRRTGERTSEMKENPRASTCCGFLQTTVWKTLNSNQLHPYHEQRVQILQPDGYPRRIAFAQW